jgi:hypothetical protein
MSHIKQAVKGNYYWTRRLSHRGYFPGEPVVKVFAKTGGKQFPLVQECRQYSGRESLMPAHPTSTHCLFATEQDAIEYYAR